MQSSLLTNVIKIHFRTILKNDKSLIIAMNADLVKITFLSSLSSQTKCEGLLLGILMHYYG
jgi:hypothetical protein